MMAEKLLRLVGPLHVVVGLLLFLTIFSPAASNLLVSHAGLPVNHPWSAVFIAFFGPTIASWGILFTGLVQSYLAAPCERQWRFLVVSILIWAPLDTGLCVYVGFWTAAVGNVFIMSAILMLLFALRKR